MLTARANSGPGAAAAIACVLLAVAIVLGGGGSPAPRAEMLVQLSAGLALCGWVFLAKDQQRSPTRIDRRVFVLSGIVIAVPLVQLIPLPPALWQVLPGREAALASLSLVGEEGRWMPLSLDPPSTWAALLALGPPLVMLFLVASLPHAYRGRLLVVIVLGGLTTVALGAVQLVVRDGSVSFYSYVHQGWIIGFQASRNLAADILLISILACATLGPWLERRGLARLWLVPMIALLALGTVLCGSRAGIALLLPTLALALVIGWEGKLPGKHIAAILAGGVSLAGMLAVVLALNVPVFQRVAARFESDSDFRSELWTDGWAAAQAYWPAGGGMGAFVAMFLPFERLEVVDATMPNRAHNDYLELLMEAGAIGILALLVCGAILAQIAWRAIRDGVLPRGQVLFAIGTIGLIAVHSILDYPLRTMSLACIFAVAVGMLTRPRHPGTGKGTKT